MQQQGAVPFIFDTPVILNGMIFNEQAETTEELNEWKSALENALAQAPAVANAVGQNPIFSTDIAEPAEAPAEQRKL